MDMEPFLNVFHGPSSLRDFHDPDKNVYLPLVELPCHPYTRYGVRIYAKMLNMLPSFNVKAFPALNMMRRAQEDGSFTPGVDEIIEYSSGNTVLSLALLHNLYAAERSNHARTTAYISNKTAETKLQLLRFFGLDLKLFGGPAQVSPSDQFGGINAAIQDGKRVGFWNPGQYHNDANSEAHVRWTGPQIYRQLPDIAVFAASIGTSGTMTGTGSFLRTVNPDIINLGVFTAPGQRVPGPRPIDLIQDIDLPWREVITDEEHVGTTDAYTMSLELCRQGILGGPSTGLALKGLYQYLEKVLNSRGEPGQDPFEELRAADGMIYCAFICSDLPYQYIPEYFTKLPASLFPGIEHKELLDVDLYPYGLDWEVSPQQVYEHLNNGQSFSPSKSGKTIVLDLREHSDFVASRGRVSADFPDAGNAVILNLDLGLAKDPNPFEDPGTLSRQWKALEERLNPSNSEFSMLYSKETKQVIILSYDGHTACVACSIVRHYGGSGYWVSGGYKAWEGGGLPTVYEKTWKFWARAKGACEALYVKNGRAFMYSRASRVN